VTAMKRLLLALAFIVAASPVIAGTSASTWQPIDPSDFEGKIRLDASVLGTWCPAKIVNKNPSLNGAKFYERNQNCYARNDWITIGPDGYRAKINGAFIECRMKSLERAGYHKSTVATYRCEDANDNAWTQQIEIGFTPADNLYITSRLSEMSQ